MKQLLKILFVAAAIVSLGGCDKKFDSIVINPNTTLDNSGLVRFTTINTYETDTYTVNVSRTEGLSKEAEFDVVIDESILTAYNELNEADYTVMPSELYTMSTTTVSFAELAKTASFDITFKPAAAIAKAGSAAAAGKYVVPFIFVPKSEINAPENRLNAMVYMLIDTSTISVQSSGTPDELTFISGVPIPRQLELVSAVNFKNPNLSRISTHVSQQMVDDYNAAKETSHVLLPQSAYSIDSGTYNAETGQIVHGIEVEGSELDASKTYLLPVKVQSSEYSVVQNSVYYVVVYVQEIKYTIVNNDFYEAATKLKHESKINVTLNGAILDAVPIEFVYDASKIAAYNDAKGKTYKAFDASKITVTGGTMAAGSLTALATVSVDMTGIGFETGDEWVLPFVIDESKLPVGAQVTGSEVVYIRLKRTLYGIWSNRNANDPRYITGTGGWHLDNYMNSTTIFNNDASYQATADYIYTNCYYTWGRGYYWYVDWSTNYQGDPNKRVIHAYSSVTSGISKENMVAWVIPIECWFDMVEGKAWMNYQYYYNQSDKDIDKRQTIKVYFESPLEVAEF